jgi:hypothetical protein
MKHVLTFAALCVSATLFACSSTQTTEESSMGAVGECSAECREGKDCSTCDKMQSDGNMGAVGTTECSGGECHAKDANMGAVGTSTECHGKTGCTDAAKDASMGAVGSSECTSGATCHGKGN